MQKVAQPGMPRIRKILFDCKSNNLVAYKFKLFDVSGEKGVNKCLKIQNLFYFGVKSVNELY